MEPHKTEASRHRITLAPEPGKECRSYSGEAGQAAQLEGPSHSTFREKLTLSYSSLRKKPLWIECDGKITVIRPILTQRGGGGKIRKIGGPISYTGALYLHQFEGVLEAINVVPLEDYLRGVVIAEIDEDYHEEAIKAQAVAARSYAIHMILFENSSRKKKLHDFDDTVRSQAYLGENPPDWMNPSLALNEEDRIKRKDIATETLQRFAQAVEATRGEVLTFDGKVIKAYFHAASGGSTELPANVWGGISAAYFRAKAELVKIDWGPRYSWLAGTQLSEITARLRKAKKISAREKLASISVDQRKGRDRFGRVQYVTARLTGGKSVTIRGAAFRSMLNLKSTYFRIESQGAKLSIIGKGSGHGVGMSQFGANHMANDLRLRSSYREILDHYYSDVRLCSVFPTGENPNTPSCSEQP